MFNANEKIYKYELIKNIGCGNFGEVWLARDHAIDSYCALKLLTQSTESIDNRLLEAKIGNRLEHNNVINIKYADVINHGPDNIPVVVIAMPYYQNGSVVSHLNSCNFMQTDLAIKCLIDVLRGLEYIHENGYYHCDIKPNNILIGDKGEYILSDYGITCYSPTHSAVQPKQCYLPHTSPETLSQNIYDTRTDIYQLGLTAFRLFNGISEISNSFLADGESFKQSVLQGSIVVNAKYQPYVPKKIRKIIKKAISVEPNNRYQTALEMRRALEQVYLKGYCTSNSKGEVISVVGNKEYRYEVHPKASNLFDIVVYQKNKTSSRETKARKYCVVGVKRTEIKSRIEKMIDELL